MPQAIAFAGARRIAAGDLLEVAISAKRTVEAGERAPLLIFDATSSRPLEIDFRGSERQLRDRLAPSPDVLEPGPARGRPKLGVTAREVTLLPRHWEWLARQPGGASATLRRLVEEARRAGAAEDNTREARDSLYRFITVMAGDAPGYEEAARALFAGDAERFTQQSAHWPEDVRAHALVLAQAAFAGGRSAGATP